MFLEMHEYDMWPLYIVVSMGVAAVVLLGVIQFFSPPKRYGSGSDIPPDDHRFTRTEAYKANEE